MDVTLWVDDTLVEVEAGPYDLDDLPDVVVVDNLTVAWDAPTELFPLQPRPSMTSFTLWVPEGAVGTFPDLSQGVKVALTVNADDYLVGRDPFVYFAGRITESPATPLRHGLAFSIVAVDFLSDLNEERQGDEYFDVDPVQNSLDWDSIWPKITALSDLNLDPAVPSQLSAGAQTFIGDRPEVGSVSTGEFVEQYLSDAFTYSGYGSGQIFPEPYFQRGTTPIWLRPFLVQDTVANGLDDPVIRLRWVASGIRSDKGTPYMPVDPVSAGQPLRWATRPDVGTDLNYTAEALYLDSGWIERGVTWRSDRKRNTNVMRVESGQGSNFISYSLAPDDLGAIKHTRKVVYRMTEAIRRYGRVLVTKASWMRSDSDARVVAQAYLGDFAQTVPGYAIDEVVVDCRGLDDDHLPRAFNPPAPAAAHNSAAYGRFVLIQRIAAAFNLARQAGRPEDYPGRLIGATFNLTKGRPTLKLAIRWGIGYPNGNPSFSYAGLTLTELSAHGGGGVSTLKLSQLGDLTFDDFKLFSDLVPPPE